MPAEFLASGVIEACLASFEEHTIEGGKSLCKMAENRQTMEQAFESPLKQRDGRSVWEPAKPFVFGGMAGMMATSIIQPLDFFKVRILDDGPYLVVL